MAEIEFYYDGMGERVMKRIRHSNEDVTWTHYVRDKMKGTGNSYDFGTRSYAPRLGRWWSVDPLEADYMSRIRGNISGIQNKS